MKAKRISAQIITCGIIIFMTLCQPSFGQTEAEEPNTQTYNSALSALRISLKHDRAQIDKLEEEIEKLKAGISSLKDSVESNSEKIKEQIEFTKSETTQKIDEIISKNSALKQELKDLTTFQGELKRLISTYNEESVQAVERIESKNSVLKGELERLHEQQSALRGLISANSKAILGDVNSLKNTQSALTIDVNNLNTNMSRQIVTIKRDVITKFLISGSAILLLLVGIIVVGVFSHKRYKGTNFIEESIKLDAKMSEILERQLLFMKGGLGEGDASKTGIGERDHSFPISVGSEIFRMRKRIASMDESTKGLNALSHALDRLEGEFGKQGYRINDLTGEQYSNGLSVKVINCIERDDFDAGTELISRVITPQIFYNGVLVSEGEVEVATSSKTFQEANGGE